MIEKRVSAKKKARDLAKYLRAERPDYVYLKRLFQHLRDELEIELPKASKKLPSIVKTLIYTGIRVSELIHIIDGYRF